MADRRPTTWRSRVLTWPARQPWVSLALLAVVVVLSLWSVSQLRIDARLEAMLASDSPASQALGHVLNDFHGNDELLVLVEAPMQRGENDNSIVDRKGRVADLWAFGERFEQSVLDDPASSLLVDRVVRGAGESGQAFVEEVVAPNLPYYLDGEQWAAFKRRLSTAGIEQQVRRNESMVALPGAAVGPMVDQSVRDPLHLYEFVAPVLERMRPGFATWRDGGRFISADGQAMLIRVVGRQSSGDAAFAEAMMASAARWATVAEAGDLRVSFAGGYAIADYSRREIRSDLIGCLAGSVAMILLLFVLLYRRPWRWLVVLPPVGVGVLAGFGVFGLVADAVTPVTAAVGGILAGLSVDYAIHYLAHYRVARQQGADVVAATDLGPGLLFALLAAAGTSVLGFAAIATSDVPLLRGFAMLGALGLAGALMATLWVLPTLLALAARLEKGTDYENQADDDDRLPIGRLVAWLDGRRWVAGAVALAAVGLLAMVLLRPTADGWFEGDMHVMHPQPNPALAAQARLAEHFQMVPDSVVVHMQAASPEALAAVVHQADAQLRDAALADVVSHVMSPAMLAPDPVKVAQRREAMARLDPQRVQHDLTRALEASVFDAAAFEDYVRSLRQTLAMTKPLPTLETLTRYPELSGMLLPRAALDSQSAPTQAQALAIVSLRQKLDDRATRAAVLDRLQAAVADLPGVTITGVPVAGHAMDTAIRHQLPRIVLLAVVLVALWGVLCLRGVGYALLALVPVAFTAACVLCFMRVVDVKLNLINMMGLPILLGVTIDAGVFLTRGWVEHRLGNMDRAKWQAQLEGSLRAIVLASLTTLLGFGSLMFASTPAIASLGLILVVGMAAGLVGSLFLLTPMLLALPVAECDTIRSS